MTNFHIDIQTTQPTFRQKLQEQLREIWIFPVGILILFVAVLLLPLLILVVVLYIYPKYLYNKFILDKTIDIVDDEPEIEAWTKLYQGKNLEIESLEIYPEAEFDDVRWHGGLLMKLRTNPDNPDLNELFFLTQSFVFANSLILFQIDKDIEVRRSKVIRLDLTTLELKLITELNEFYIPAFKLLDRETLIILCQNGYKRVEITLSTDETENVIII